MERDRVSKVPMQPRRERDDVVSDTVFHVTYISSISICSGLNVYISWETYKQRTLTDLRTSLTRPPWMQPNW